MDPELAQWLFERMHYLAGDFRSPDLAARLETGLRELETQHHTRGNAVFYLATPPDFFGIGPAP